MVESEQCSAQGCERLAEASLDDRSLCWEHFISTCYTRLEECTQLMQERPFRDNTPRFVRQFVYECVEQANGLAQKAQDLDDLERARLLDILFWAGELGHRLRRSSRKEVSVPIRVCSEERGRSWEEEIKTQLVSQHGARVECHFQVEIGDTLLVTRMDSGRQARTRVTWCERKSGGRFEIGLEFVDCDNFWELNWKGEQSGV